jgi:hypothetical protein
MAFVMRKHTLFPLSSKKNVLWDLTSTIVLETVSSISGRYDRQRRCWLSLYGMRAPIASQTCGG